MDFEKLQKQIETLDKQTAAIAEGEKAGADGLEKDAKLRDRTRQAMRDFAGALRQVLMDFLKDRKEPVRTGQIYRDAAAKNFVPGDVAGDNLIIKWGGNVTPGGARDIHEECAKFRTVAEKVLPVLKAYKKE